MFGSWNCFCGLKEVRNGTQLNRFPRTTSGWFKPQLPNVYFCGDTIGCGCVSSSYLQTWRHLTGILNPPSEITLRRFWWTKLWKCCRNIRPTCSCYCQLLADAGFNPPKKRREKKGILRSRLLWLKMFCSLDLIGSWCEWKWDRKRIKSTHQLCYSSQVKISPSFLERLTYKWHTGSTRRTVSRRVFPSTWEDRCERGRNSHASASRSCPCCQGAILDVFIRSRVWRLIERQFQRKVQWKLTLWVKKTAKRPCSSQPRLLKRRRQATPMSFGRIFNTSKFSEWRAFQ